MKTIYVGMGLTQAPEEFRNDFQHELKDGLRELPGVEILDFYGVDLNSTKDGVEKDIYIHDREYAESAGLCVFIADHPSIGLGMEIALRLATGKSMLIFAHEDAKITRMLIGMCEDEDVELIRYRTAEDIVERVREEL